MTHTEWPMTAVIQRRNAEGEWVHYSQISTVEDAEVWIAKREVPGDWRALPI
jgi:hypothetical protein